MGFSKWLIMTHLSHPGKQYNRSCLLSLENNSRHANDSAKTLTIKKLKYLNRSFALISIFKLKICFFEHNLQNQPPSLSREIMVNNTTTSTQGNNRKKSRKNAQKMCFSFSSTYATKFNSTASWRSSSSFAYHVKTLETILKKFIHWTIQVFEWFSKFEMRKSQFHKNHKLLSAIFKICETVIKEHNFIFWSDHNFTT